MTAHNKYSLLNRDNLTQPIQTKLSQKQKTCSQFFSPFLKSTLNFEHFQKKEDPDSWCISEIKWMSKKSRFRRPFDKRHGKQVETLLKSERHDLEQIIVHGEGNWCGKNVS